MNNWRDQEPVRDEDLVAYLDGKFEKDDVDWLEHEVAKNRALEQRLELMRRGNRPFAEAYDLLLKDAPDERLMQLLKLARNPPPPPVKKPVAAPKPEQRANHKQEVNKTSWRGWRMLAAAIVLMAVFSGGLVTSRFVPLPGELPQIAGASTGLGWRARVASYQKLFVKETLAGASRDAETQSANLRTALASVGLDLSVRALSVRALSVIPLEFKRAEALNYKGKPLVQVAYLFNGEIPVSFCIILVSKPAFGIKAERREGLNIAHWRSSDFGFMVIGDVPQSELNRIARKLKQQLS